MVFSIAKTLTVNWAHNLEEVSWSNLRENIFNSNIIPEIIFIINIYVLLVCCKAISFGLYVDVDWTSPPVPRPPS